MRPNCYNCDTNPAHPNSVFCETCAPAMTNAAMTNTLLPPIIHERPEEPPRPPEGWRSWLTRIFAPYRHASNLAARFEALYREFQDTAQSNLALRRKCADLKAQVEAVSFNEDENDRQVDCLESDLAEIRAKLADCTGQQGQLKLSLEKEGERVSALEAQNASLRAELSSAKEELAAMEAKHGHSC
jgi:predicted RNase H-like nuclease (RuvC/YqgF family)